MAKMKPGIHPPYYLAATITCSCGASYTIGATIPTLKLEICRACHPFYTGSQKLVDTAGRVDRFRAKVARARAQNAGSMASRPADATEV